MRERVRPCTVLMILVMILAACSGGEMEKEKAENKVIYPVLTDVPDAVWNQLSSKKIYFGHQSVGFNIMDGVQDLMRENPKIKLNVVESTQSKDISPGTWLHSKVGQNRDPQSKMDDFEKFLEAGIGNKADVAMLKLCYVDITVDTDVNKVFTQYKEKMEIIQKKYPKLRMVHFTVPLTVSKTTWKTQLKKMIGKTDLHEFANNIKRNQYNALILQEYQGKALVLDLAAIESTQPDGIRQSFELKDVIYYSLYPGYTTDGGHLNDVGRKKVAEQLLLLLVNLN